MPISGKHYSYIHTAFFLKRCTGRNVWFEIYGIQDKYRFNMVNGTYLLSFKVGINKNGHYLLKMANWIRQIVQFIVFFYRWQNSVSQLLFIYILVICLLVQWQLRLWVGRTSHIVLSVIYSCLIPRIFCGVGYTLVLVLSCNICVTRVRPVCLCISASGGYPGLAPGTVCVPWLLFEGLTELTY